MHLRFKMLDHPFYQAWTKGEVSRKQLADYHRSYAIFVERIPAYWEKVVTALDADSARGRNVVNEERQHINLWDQWARSFDRSSDSPPMTDILSRLDSMTPSMLLGAIHAFEVQQPEVARTKKEGLMKFYGCAESELLYFDEHQKEEEHVKYGTWLADQRSVRTEFEEGFKQGSELMYHSLDRFV